MALRGVIDKLVGMVAPAGWSVLAASGQAATLAEPISATIIGATILATHLRKQNRDVCASALKKARTQIEKEVRKDLGQGSSFAPKFDRIFDELDEVLGKMRPSADDLVGKWKFNPELIAAGMVARFAEHSELFASDHLARQVAEDLVGRTINVVKDDPDLYAKLEPAIAREMLGALAGIEARLEDIAGDTGNILAEARQSNDEIQAKLDLLLSGIAAGDMDRVESAGVPNDVIIDMARKINSSVDDPGFALAELEDAIDRLLRAIEQGELSRTGNNYVDAALAEIAELTKKGKFKEGSRLAAAAYQHWQENEDERQENARKVGLRVLDVGIEQDLFDRDFAAAARGVWQKVELEEADSSKRFDALRAAQDEWYVRGRDKGLNLDLEVAIGIARLALGRAEGVDERGTACNDLGIALSILGERESGTDRLEAAAAAYRTALEELTRDRVPLDWAMTQNNLGNVLLTLGGRESGTDRLEAAVVAYREALKECTQGKVPLQWATAQNNLGTALRELGERESGTERLEAAVDAYRAALEEQTRDRVPLDWAMTQNNLGNVLSILGGRESGTDRLEAAVVAYREALKEYTQDKVPLQWATAQNNLGNALSILGERESGTEGLEAAVVAYRAALEECTQDRVPLDWAMAQNNLGDALFCLGERESASEGLEAALVAYRAALEEYTQDRVPLGWANTMGSLAVAKMAIAARTSDCAMAQDAAQQMLLAFETLRDGGHDAWASTLEQQLPAATALVAKLCG